MDYTVTVDHDDILRARKVLLASGRRTTREEADAYRILARVNPAAYLPRLVSSLHQLSYDRLYDTRHQTRLALLEEAVAAARAIDPAEPARPDVLYRALDAYQGQLYTLGRRAEGLAVRAEMVAVGREQAAASGDRAVKGLSVWAAGLCEEGRYSEAADALTEWVAAIRPKGSRSGAFAWSLLEWVGALDAAGRSGEALAAFEELVRLEAADVATDRGPMACHLYTLIRYAQMLDIRGRRGEATVVRHEALALLTELAATGERKSWSGYQATYWAVLLSLSGSDSEWPVASSEPHPPLGATPMDWSPGVRQRYFSECDDLTEELRDLEARATEDPWRHLPELIRVHRALTIRSAVYWEKRTHLFADEARHLFDEGVDLARRLYEHNTGEGAAILATALTDRSTFRTACKEFEAALDDFRQALEVLGTPGIS
ncbi:hypothetical protein [Streptomyces coffeae]|uniref:Tetratricopeptide repeat protein n=1 Tax=Streptomyces coffeae TaxID=621382 RepID=A0ABS1NF11_9ACTN|nr:hypothetical protein [Streptomyces coffeae]MBL1098633.1 hypothetical protein [Streptomyces coffeae]